MNSNVNEDGKVEGEGQDINGNINMDADALMASLGFKPEQFNGTESDSAESLSERANQYSIDNMSDHEISKRAYQIVADDILDYFLKKHGMGHFTMAPEDIPEAMRAGHPEGEPAYDGNRALFTVMAAMTCNAIQNMPVEAKRIYLDDLLDAVRKEASLFIKNGG